ncbi:hypothetical protein [Streptomyces chartreusis]
MCQQFTPTLADRHLELCPVVFRPSPVTENGARLAAALNAG